LTVNVTERKTNSFQAGLTHNPNSGLAGLLDLTLKNYFGRAKRIKTKWEYGANKKHYEFGYTDPWAAWLFDSKTSIDFSLYNKEDTYVDDKKEKKRGGDFSIGRQLTDSTKGYIGLDISKTRQEDEESWQDDRILNLRTIRNTTINPRNPRTGSKQTISLEKSGLLGGDKDYTKYSFDFRNYMPSLEENSWAFRLKIAGSRGELTDTKRYYLAGRDGVRGYEDNYYKTNEDDNYDPEAEGFIGNSVLLGSVEYRYPIIDKLRGLVFVDAGKTFASDDINLYADGSFKYSAGLGMRVATPIGELGLDYGYAPEADKYSKSDLKFTIGNKF
jgi:outer membrane protein insertion porin family